MESSSLRNIDPAAAPSVDPRVPAGVRVLKTLAQSPLAEVLLVETEGLPRQQVWKLLRSEVMTDDPENLARFLDEVGVCQRLEHRNLALCLGAGRTPEGRLYLASEHLIGSDLGTWLQSNGPMSAEQALSLFVQLAEALSYVHGKGVVHRDLCPGNVFLCGVSGQPFQAKILDFGVSHFQGGVRTVQTTAGTILTKPEYCAPECIRGHRGDARTDLYALGALMFEALTGEPPFTDAEYSRVLAMHLTQMPPELPEGAGHLAPIIQRCLAKEPEDRFASAQELLTALDDFGELPAVPQQGQPSTAVMPRPVVSAAVGDTLGSYELVELLGDGGMGQVFLAHHKKLGRRVAIKVLKAEQSRRPELVHRFFQEARAVNRINHPHIVEIFDFVDEPLEGGSRRSYCVMEMLDGATLRGELDSARLTLPRALRILRQVCSALEAAHQVGVIHRDIKPDNLLITERSGPFVKVLDFGVAKLQREEEGEQMSNTLAGLIIGTPAYMAPEQVSGKAIDGRTDQYAVGTLLYEILAGALPFDAPAFLELAYKVNHTLPPALPEFTPAGEWIPERLKAICIRCLEKDPANRYPSMRALAEELEPFDLSRDAAAVQPLPAPRTQSSVSVPSTTVVMPPRRTAKTSSAVPASSASSATSKKVGRWALRGAALFAVASAGFLMTRAIQEGGLPLSGGSGSDERTLSMTLRVSSSPEGALVTRLDTGESLGKTPFSVELPGGDDELGIRFDLTGYEPVARTVNRVGYQAVTVSLKKLGAQPTPPAERNALFRESGRAPLPAVDAEPRGTDVALAPAEAANLKNGPLPSENEAAASPSNGLLTAEPTDDGNTAEASPSEPESDTTTPGNGGPERRARSYGNGEGVPPPRVLPSRRNGTSQQPGQKSKPAATPKERLDRDDLMDPYAQ